MSILRDFLLSIVLLGIPSYLVIRLNGRGVIYGTLVMWFMVYAVGEIQRAGDSRYDGFGLGVWIFAGWFFSFLYCLFIFCGKKLFVRYKMRREKDKMRNY